MGETEDKLQPIVDQFRLKWFTDVVKQNKLDEAEYETLVELLMEELDNAPCYCDFAS